MDYKLYGDTFAVCLYPGEEALKCIELLCEKENINAGVISGLGAADKITVGVYDLEKREFAPKEITAEMEICGLAGNVSRKDGNPYLHLHGSFADKDGRIYGGHVSEIHISVTAEIFIRVLPGTINRKQDAQTDIQILNFEEE